MPQNKRPFNQILACGRLKRERRRAFCYAGLRMRILFILPGSGGSFYCQNCLRDTVLAAALQRRGHPVTLMPLYLPATAAMPAPEEVPVFYGAVTLYLRHRFAGLRRLPRSWFKPLDRWPVLRLAARFAGSTSASGLEDLTLSMLRGPDGHQADELNRVAEWVAGLPASERPSVILLSNALLAGLARTLSEAAGCPVACWLQDEHVWLDAMAPQMRAAALRILRDDARAIDRFLAVSSSYAERMTDLLALDPARVRVVIPGVDPEAYAPADTTRRPATLGFLSRLSAEEGFDRFVDAFLLLRCDPRFTGTRLAATGGPSADKRFLTRQRRKLADAGLLTDTEISPGQFSTDRFGFLSRLTLLSVPGGAVPEALGYYALEALAAGVPVVLPAQGAFPELVSRAGCGTLLPDTRPESLAQAWAGLLSDPERLRRDSEQGRRAAASIFSHDAAALALEQALA
ncbi:MAG TPA: glycosyltransferase family 4 protein [Kiritimatiellia bacterium]|jgi:glycosyltransferase involved in cell wall biosynthesis|nr:glycosyltransferase family 4 protein [Kiritimatiellia bacterium]